jgi:hypothetical protein
MTLLLTRLSLLPNAHWPYDLQYSRKVNHSTQQVTVSGDGDAPVAIWTAFQATARNTACNQPSYPDGNC